MSFVLVFVFFSDMLFSYHGNIMKVLIAYLNESVGNDDYNVADICSSFFNVLLMEDSDLFIAVLLSVFFCFIINRYYNTMCKGLGYFFVCINIFNSKLLL